MDRPKQIQKGSRVYYYNPVEDVYAAEDSTIPANIMLESLRTDPDCREVLDKTLHLEIIL